MPSKPSTIRATSYYKRIASVLGVCLATITFNEGGVDDTNEADAYNAVMQCRAQVGLELKKEEEQVKEGENSHGLSKQEVVNARSRNSEIGYDGVMLKHHHGGEFYNMKRLPSMGEVNPGVRGNVYMNFPEFKGKDPRAIVYFHGNGGQSYGNAAENNVVRWTNAMQEKGDQVIFIGPVDGWGNFKPEEGYKKKPGNWRDFNDPDTLSNLLSFAEGIHGKGIQHITLASFSGGNIGIMKVLRSLERMKNADPKMAEIYRKIQRIAYFDSATGAGSDFVARWMAQNPQGKLGICYRKGSVYQNGNDLLLQALEKQKVDPERAHTETLKFNQRHSVYEEYFVPFTSFNSD